MVIEQDIPPVKTDPAHASFLRAARAGNLEKVIEYLKSSIDINHSNANGLNSLHLAAKENHAEIVRLLLKKGAKVNSATVKGNTALHIASLGGHVDVVKILIEEGADLNCRSKAGFTALYMASQEDRLEVVHLLLNKGANQSLGTDDGFTPLAVALQQGHDRIVSLLLQYDAKGKVRLPPLHLAAKKDDCQAAMLLLNQAEQQRGQHSLPYAPVDQPSKSGFTALHISAHYGNERVARILLQHNAQVNHCAKHLITPLHVAAKWGQLRMVEILVKWGANVAAVTRDGLSALHCAARSGHEHVVRYLLHDCEDAPGSVPGIQLCALKTKNGLTPLHMSAQGDHVSSAKALLETGALVDDVTGDYLTALHVSCHCGHVDVSKLLLDYGSDVNSRALNGFSPLHIACKKNRIKVVELLLKYGANIEATTESGLSCLHVAAFMGCMNIVILLLQRGAFVDAQTVRGETALHLACRASQLDIVLILLRNRANVNAVARENQAPIHIAARVGNLDIIQALLDNGAEINGQTSHLFTPLHISSKENQEEVTLLLLERGANINATSKSGFTPLHLSVKYGNIKITKLLIAKNADINVQGKNGLTALHVAAHYDHPEIALLLLSHGADAKITARNGYTALHIAAKKGQLDTCIGLLEYGCSVHAQSKAGFTPLHLGVQNGHSDVVSLLIQHRADVNAQAKNGLTPLHLCAQEDRVNIATVLLRNKCDLNPQTKSGYTPLHCACHFGQHNMIQFLLNNGAEISVTTQTGYTPLHSASQQGHLDAVNTLLNKDSSVANQKSSDGQTALRIAQRLGYMSVVSTLIEKTTETMIMTETSEERYKVEVPEQMHETFMSDSEDEHAAADDTHTGEQMRYLTAEDGYHNSSANLDGSRDYHNSSMDQTADKISRDFEPNLFNTTSLASLLEEEPNFSPSHYMMTESYMNSLLPDNVDLTKSPTVQGKLKWKSFLVSFMVDARGGAMRGCRHSGVRILIAPGKASQPMRVTCKYVRKEKLLKPPPMMEGEECASRILELSPPGVKFLGPIIIEVPHFASLRGQEREILILRSDNGESWKEHTYLSTPEAVEEILHECFSEEADMTALNSEYTPSRITRILTTDFPNYFALITRIKQDVQAVGPDGGVLNSTICQQVQAIFPTGSLTKRIRVGLQVKRKVSSKKKKKIKATNKESTKSTNKTNESSDLFKNPKKISNIECKVQFLPNNDQPIAKDSDLKKRNCLQDLFKFSGDNLGESSLKRKRSAFGSEVKKLGSIDECESKEKIVERPTSKCDATCDVSSDQKADELEYLEDKHKFSFHKGINLIGDLFKKSKTDEEGVRVTTSRLGSTPIPPAQVALANLDEFLDETLIETLERKLITKKSSKSTGDAEKLVATDKQGECKILDKEIDNQFDNKLNRKHKLESMNLFGNSLRKHFKVNFLAGKSKKLDTKQPAALHDRRLSLTDSEISLQPPDYQPPSPPKSDSSSKQDSTKIHLKKSTSSASLSPKKFAFDIEPLPGVLKIEKSEKQRLKIERQEKKQLMKKDEKLARKELKKKKQESKKKKLDKESIAERQEKVPSPTVDDVAEELDEISEAVENKQGEKCPETLTHQEADAEPTQTANSQSEKLEITKVESDQPSNNKKSKAPKGKNKRKSKKQQFERTSMKIKVECFDENNQPVLVKEEMLNEKLQAKDGSDQKMSIEKLQDPPIDEQSLISKNDSINEPNKRPKNWIRKLFSSSSRMAKKNSLTESESTQISIVKFDEPDKENIKSSVKQSEKVDESAESEDDKVEQAVGQDFEIVDETKDLKLGKIQATYETDTLIEPEDEDFEQDSFKKTIKPASRFIVGKLFKKNPLKSKKSSFEVDVSDKAAPSIQLVTIEKNDENSQTKDSNADSFVEDQLDSSLKNEIVTTVSAQDSEFSLRTFFNSKFSNFSKKITDSSNKLIRSDQPQSEIFTIDSVDQEICEDESPEPFGNSKDESSEKSDENALESSRDKQIKSIQPIGQLVEPQEISENERGLNLKMTKFSLPKFLKTKIAKEQNIAPECLKNKIVEEKMQTSKKEIKAEKMKNETQKKDITKEENTELDDAIGDKMINKTSKISLPKFLKIKKEKLTELSGTEVAIKIDATKQNETVETKTTEPDEMSKEDEIRSSIKRKRISLPGFFRTGLTKKQKVSSSDFTKERVVAEEMKPSFNREQVNDSASRTKREYENITSERAEQISMQKDETAKKLESRFSVSKYLSKLIGEKLKTSQPEIATEPDLIKDSVSLIEKNTEPSVELPILDSKKIENPESSFSRLLSDKLDSPFEKHEVRVSAKYDSPPASEITPAPEKKLAELKKSDKFIALEATETQSFEEKNKPDKSASDSSAEKTNQLQSVADSTVSSIRNRKKKRSPRKSKDNRKKESQIPVPSRENSKDTLGEKKTEISQQKEEPKISKNQTTKDETNDINTVEPATKKPTTAKSTKKQKKSRLPKPTQVNKLEIRPRDSIELAKTKAKTESKIKITITDSSERKSEPATLESKNNVEISQSDAEESCKQLETDKKDSESERSMKVDSTSDQEISKCECANQEAISLENKPQSRSSVVKEFFKNIKLTKSNDNKELVSVEGSLRAKDPTNRPEDVENKNLSESDQKENKRIKLKRFRLKKLLAFDKKVDSTFDRSDEVEVDIKDSAAEKTKQPLEEKKTQPEIVGEIEESSAEKLSGRNGPEKLTIESRKLFSVNLNMPRFFGKKQNKEKVSSAKVEHANGEDSFAKEDSQSLEETIQNVKSSSVNQITEGAEKPLNKKLFRVKLKPIKFDLHKISELLPKKSDSAEFSDVEIEQVQPVTTDQKIENCETSAFTGNDKKKSIDITQLQPNKKLLRIKLKPIKSNFRMPKLFNKILKPSASSDGKIDGNSQLNKEEIKKEIVEIIQRAKEYVETKQTKTSIEVIPEKNEESDIMDRIKQIEMEDTEILRRHSQLQLNEQLEEAGRKANNENVEINEPLREQVDTFEKIELDQLEESEKNLKNAESVQNNQQNEISERTQNPESTTSREMSSLHSLSLKLNFGSVSKSSKSAKLEESESIVEAITKSGKEFSTAETKKSRATESFSALALNPPIKKSNILRLFKLKKVLSSSTEQNLFPTHENEELQILKSQKPSDLRKSKLSDIFRFQKKLSIINETNVDTITSLRDQSASVQGSILRDETIPKTSDGTTAPKEVKSSLLSRFKITKLTFVKESSKAISEPEKLTDGSETKESKTDYSRMVESDISEIRGAKPDEIKHKIDAKPAICEKQKSTALPSKKSRFKNMFKIKRVTDRHRFPPIIKEPSKLVENLLSSKESESRPRSAISITIDDSDRKENCSPRLEEPTENQEMLTVEQKDSVSSSPRTERATSESIESKVFSLFRMKKSPKCDDFKKLTDELNQSASANNLNDQANTIGNLEGSSQDKLDSTNNSSLSKRIFKLSSIFKSSRKSSKSSTSQLSNTDEKDADEKDAELSKNELDSSGLKGSDDQSDMAGPYNNEKLSQTNKSLIKSSEQLVLLESQAIDKSRDLSTQKNTETSRKINLPNIFKFERTNSELIEPVSRDNPLTKENNEHTKKTDDEKEKPLPTVDQRPEENKPSSKKSQKISLTNIFKSTKSTKDSETAEKKAIDTAEKKGETKISAIQKSPDDTRIPAVDLQGINNLEKLSTIDSKDATQKLFDLSNVFKFKISIKGSELNEQMNPDSIAGEKSNELSARSQSTLIEETFSKEIIDSSESKVSSIKKSCDAITSDQANGEASKLESCEKSVDLTQDNSTPNDAQIEMLSVNSSEKSSEIHQKNKSTSRQLKATEKSNNETNDPLLNSESKDVKLNEKTLKKFKISKILRFRKFTKQANEESKDDCLTKLNEKPIAEVTNLNSTGELKIEDSPEFNEQEKESKKSAETKTSLETQYQTTSGNKADSASARKFFDSSNIFKLKKLIKLNAFETTNPSDEKESENEDKLATTDLSDEKSECLRDLTDVQQSEDQATSIETIKDDGKPSSEMGNNLSLAKLFGLKKTTKKKSDSKTPPEESNEYLVESAATRFASVKMLKLAELINFKKASGKDAQESAPADKSIAEDAQPIKDESEKKASPVSKEDENLVIPIESKPTENSSSPHTEKKCAEKNTRESDDSAVFKVPDDSLTKLTDKKMETNSESLHQKAKRFSLSKLFKIGNITSKDTSEDEIKDAESFEEKFENKEHTVENVSEDDPISADENSDLKSGVQKSRQFSLSKLLKRSSKEAETGAEKPKNESNSEISKFKLPSIGKKPEKVPAPVHSGAKNLISKDKSICEPQATEKSDESVYGGSRDMITSDDKLDEKSLEDEKSNDKTKSETKKIHQSMQEQISVENASKSRKKFALSKMFRFKKSIEKDAEKSASVETTAEVSQPIEDKENIITSSKELQAPEKLSADDNSLKSEKNQLKQTTHRAEDNFALSKLFKFKKSSEKEAKESSTADESAAKKSDVKSKGKDSVISKEDTSLAKSAESQPTDKPSIPQTDEKFALSKLFALKNFARKYTPTERLGIGKPADSSSKESTEEKSENRESNSEDLLTYNKDSNVENKLSPKTGRKFSVPKLFSLKKSVKKDTSTGGPFEKTSDLEEKSDSPVRSKFSLPSLFKKLTESSESTSKDLNNVTETDGSIKPSEKSDEKLEEEIPIEEGSQPCDDKKPSPKSSKRLKMPELLSFKKGGMKDKVANKSVDKLAQATDEFKPDISEQQASVEPIFVSEEKSSNFKNLSKTLTLPLSNLIRRKQNSKEYTPVDGKSGETQENLEMKSPETVQKSDKKVVIVESERHEKALSPSSEQRGIWDAIKDTFSTNKQQNRHEGDSSMEPTVDETGYESQVDADLEVEEFSAADVTVTQTIKLGCKADSKALAQNNHVESEEESRHDSGKDESLLEDSSISEAKSDQRVKSRKEARKVKKAKKHQPVSAAELTSPEEEGSSDMIPKGSKSKADRKRRQKKKRQQTEQLTKELKEPLRKVDEEMDGQSHMESLKSQKNDEDEIKQLELIDTSTKKVKIVKPLDDKKLIEQEELQLAITQSKELQAAEKSAEKNIIKIVSKRKHRRWLNINRLLNRTNSNVSSNFMQSFLRLTMPNLDVLSSM